MLLYLAIACLVKKQLRSLSKNEIHSSFTAKWFLAKSFKFLCSEAIYDFILLLFLHCIQFATLKKIDIALWKTAREDTVFNTTKFFLSPKKANAKK